MSDHIEDDPSKCPAWCPACRVVASGVAPPAAPADAAFGATSGIHAGLAAQVQADIDAGEAQGRDLARVQELIAGECDALKALLLAKNAKYGNSALEPVRIFSQASPVEQILVRVDDKLKRLKNMRGFGAAADEDTVQDLLGYLILLRIAARLEKQ